MRRGAVAIALAGALGLVSAPALADGPSRTVAAQADNTFSPETLTIAPGTTVSWENRGLQHNVHFEDGQFDQPADPSSTPWRVWRRFDQPGVYRYYCETHGGPGGQGMSGTVIVESGANPVMSGMKVTPKRVCNRRTHHCRTTVARATFKLSEDARVAGGVDPVGGKAGRPGRDLEMQGKKGANSLRISARKLKPGLYKVTLNAEDQDGNESDPATAYFRVKRAHS